MLEGECQHLFRGQIDGPVKIDIEFVPPAPLGFLQAQLHLKLVFRRVDARIEKLGNDDFGLFKAPSTKVQALGSKRRTEGGDHMRWATDETSVSTSGRLARGLGKEIEVGRAY